MLGRLSEYAVLTVGPRFTGVPQSLSVVSRVVIYKSESPYPPGRSELKKSDKYAHLPFILFTGKGQPETIKECLEKGADRYITKGGATAEKQCHELVKAIWDLVRGEEGKEEG